MLTRTLKKIVAGLGILIVLGLAVVVVICLIPIEPTVEPITPRASTRYWTMSGGYRIAYTRVPARGTERRPPILFVHGGPGGYIHSHTIETMGRLSELGRDVYLYDQVGSGLSDRLEKPKDYSFLGHVEDLREIVTRHLGAERVALIGHSYGGQLVSYFVAHHPELVEKAVLSAPDGIQPLQFDEEGRYVNADKYPIPDSLNFKDSYDVTDIWAVRAWPLRAIATVALATTLNVKLMSDQEADGVLNSLIAKFSKGLVCDTANVVEGEGGGGMYAHGWSNWFGDVEDWRPGLRAVDVPVLVVHGQCDIIPYAMAFEYADLIPRGEYRFVEGAGHKIWWDRPDAFVSEISRFLQRAEPSAVRRPVEAGG